MPQVTLLPPKFANVGNYANARRAVSSLVLYGMVWYGMVWYGMVWYSTRGVATGAMPPPPNFWQLFFFSPINLRCYVLLVCK